MIKFIKKLILSMQFQGSRIICFFALWALCVSPAAAALQITVHEFTEDVLEFSINGSVNSLSWDGSVFPEGGPAQYSDRWILDGGDAKDWFSGTIDFTKVSGEATRRIRNDDPQDPYNSRYVNIPSVMAARESHSIHGDHLRGVNNLNLTSYSGYDTTSLGGNLYLAAYGDAGGSNGGSERAYAVSYNNLRYQATGTFRPEDVTSFSVYWGAGNDAVLQSVTDVSSFVPEPSAYALLLGASGLICVLLRRRKNLSQ